MDLHKQDALATLKAIIYGYQRVPVSVIQQCFLIDHHDDVPILVAQLQKHGLLQAVDHKEPYTINWQHPDWQSMASQRDLWQSWADHATLGCYSVKKQGEQWCVICEVYGYTTVIAHVASEDEGSIWIWENLT